ncbi:MAG: alkaline phosphatase family protein [Kofleriaceae bacterium]|nr:alkaline phosphatase family protein [Kofleriaceae bacterium]
MKSSRLSILLFGSLCFAITTIVVAYVVADGYIDRLPNHQGYFLVPVENTVSIAPVRSPKRTAFVLIDGLGLEFARDMQAAKTLSRIGQCHPTDAGSLTISRPMYTVISTGVEVDRTGARNNDDTAPVPVQSIWQVANIAGLNVHAASALPWWDELFPSTFASYLRQPDESANLFAQAKLGDLSIIHPLRVDSAGHKYGSASQEYRDAVALTNTELSAFIESLNFETDLLIVTADHGHSASGGHGGPLPDVSQVLTCFAGPGVLASSEASPIDAKTIAPTMSVLLGLPFPKHMRAGEDSLDQIWTIVDPTSLGVSYISQRHKDIEGFRQANSKQLGQWLGHDEGLWSELYSREGRTQSLWWAATILLALVVLACSYRLRKFSVKRAGLSLVWIATITVTIVILYGFVRGTLDFTSINLRDEFINASVSICLSVGVIGLAIHAFFWRSLHTMLADQLTLIALLLLVGVMHFVAYGVPLGFPMPGRFMLFLPFLYGAMGISLGLLCTLLAGTSLALHFRKT